jgi:hypothetical protein
MKMRPFLLALFLAVLAHCNAKSRERLAVHEWGTFTSLQDEAGDSIGGINTDDEPVPDFVHRLINSRWLFLNRSEAPPAFFQGAPRCHPDVTMRLETPVLYFYPPDGGFAQAIDVRVEFRGGWLTEFYPGAEAKAPGFDSADPDRVFPALASKQYEEFKNGFGHLQRDRAGELSWTGVKLGADGAGPETNAKVWLAPRAVQSAMLRTPQDERERFLFYRGVGNIDAGLKVVRNEAQKTLEIRDRAPSEPPVISQAWLVEVRADGRCAHRSIGSLPADKQPRAEVPASFPPEAFGDGRLESLQKEMRAALIANGLFADEADALLRTWEISYFKSRGLRLFYVCPPSEIERLLPLHISVPCDITRVMIGRIEIVTPEQRTLLARIAAGPPENLSFMRGVTGDSQSDFFKNPENMRRWNAVMSGDAPYRELGLPIPAIYDAYLQLGRFRNALLLDEEKRRPTPELREYIKTNRFDAYRIGVSDRAQF